MKKLLISLILSAVTLCSLFAFAACRNGGNEPSGKDEETELPDPAPIDYVKVIAGVWRLESFEYEMTGGEGTPMTPEVPFAELTVTSEATFTYAPVGVYCTGTVTGTLGEKTFEFKGTAGELSITSSARYDPDRKTLTFTNLVFEGGTPEYPYRSATFRRPV